MRWKRKKHRKQCRVYKDGLLPSPKPERIYTDNQQEFIKACQDLLESSHRHLSSVRNERSGRQSRPQSERRHSPRPSATWTTTRMVGLCDNMLCKLLMARQHSRKDMVILLTGHQFPSIEYVPITAKDKSWIHQFGQKTLKWRFSGHVLCAWGGWSGDLMMADYEDLQEIAEIYVKRFKNCKEYS